MGQQKDAEIGLKANRLGQSGVIKNQDILSDPGVRNRRNQANSESFNLFKAAQNRRLDLGIRFSKIVFADVNADTSRLPLRKRDYPIDHETCLWLGNSQCPSVIIPENCYECDTHFPALIKAIHGKPTHPSRNPNSTYWDELREVILMQAHRLNGTDPKDIMPIPKIWKNFTIEEVAVAVHNEVRQNVIENLTSFFVSLK